MNGFVSIVKIAATAFPVTSALSQWLSEIEAARMEDRIRLLENPLSKYGQKAPGLCKLIYAKIKDLDDLTIDWCTDFKSYRTELRHFQSDSLVEGLHVIGTNGEFSKGFSLTNPRFVIYLATLNGDSDACEELNETIESSDTSLDGNLLKNQLNLPLVVIDSFFCITKLWGKDSSPESLTDLAIDQSSKKLHETHPPNTPALVRCTGDCRFCWVRDALPKVGLYWRIH